MLKYLIVQLANIYTTILFVYVLMSWIPNKRGIIADIDTALGKLCDPFLRPFQRIIPPIGGMVDVSPIFALIVLQFVVQLIVRIL
ncbi:YggT family protein [Slackia heliotrinireducens]|jgi:YggT family protein|uniref:YGGT family protein n=1 Tax=Slackia heliotrinireducens (strain ATCC 29202 / DSM 20476 / NCTC 11029 / RHS 1) TaxID=471855 RepID=C7N4V5_SLAHD|nr:YggT family protein [Slackia heliotrinireducens]ACV21940.1 YGGT family protein [Slackia heliotrinireducens DSM 20476]VEG99778.1 YGGT family [Slackia heliotrinireducens]